MIAAVLFDLDDTLCEYRRPRADVLSAAFERTEVDPFFELEDYYAVWDEYAVPGEPKAVQIAKSFVALATERGIDADVGRSVARAFADEIDHRDVRFLPGAREALEALADSHRLGIVTNGAPDMQATKLDALGIADCFETIVHGSHDAPAKPSPEPFHRALESLSVEPRQAVYAGDSLESDVAGAEAAGLQTAWVPTTPDADAGDYEPDYVLESLGELAEIPWTGGE